MKKLSIIPALIITFSVLFLFSSYEKKKEFTMNDYIEMKKVEKLKTKPTYGYPDKALQWYYEQRSYPSGEIPVGWREEAMKHIERENTVEFSNESAALNWTQVGPGNIGGRIRSIVVHPTNGNIIYIGAVSGGVWKTTNGGSSWTPLKDFMENLAVCALAMDPFDFNILYAGTGEGFFNLDAIRGEGIFKTTDGGATWTQLSSTVNTNFHYVNKLAINKNTGQLFAATRTGLFVSANGGATFNTALSGNHCMDVEIAETNQNLMYASFGHFANSTVHRSTNGGNSWSPVLSQSGHGRAEIAISPSNSQIAYVSFHDLNTNGVTVMGRTTDGGTNWFSVSVPGPSFSGASNYAGQQAWYDNILAIDPQNSSTIYAGGIDFWKSTNGGTSWTQKSNWYTQSGAPPYVHADHHAIAFDPSNGNIMYLGTDGGIFKSTNKGESWTALNNNLFITQFYYGAVHPSQDRYFGGTQDNGTIGTSSGTNWIELIGGDGGATEVDYNNPQNMYGEYIYFAFFKSTNGGISFTKSMNGIPQQSGTWGGTTDRTLFITPFIMDPNNPQIILGGTYRVWRTTNGASSWSAISTDLTGDGSGSNGATISTLAVANGNSNVIYVGTSNGRVQVTTNGGTNWNLRNTGLPNLYCTRVAVSPNDNGTAYATFSGFTSGSKVYKTTNFGTSWTNISNNLPNIPVNCIFVNPENVNNLFIGTDLGIFSSDNGGSSWVADKNGMANVSVHDLDYRASDKKLVAATHGRSMYAATVGGGGGGTVITVLQQGFDSQSFPPSGWQTFVTNSNNTWMAGNPQNNNFNTIDPTSTFSAICPWVAQNQNEWIISPQFSLGSGTASIEFYAAHSTAFLNFATLKFHISTNGGTNWTQLWEAQNDGQGFKWRQININLNQYQNQNNLRVAWQYVGNDGDLVGVDGIKLNLVTSLEDDTDLTPKEFSISQNYPNPFNPSTVISYQLSALSKVELNVYDILGKKITTLVNENQNAGKYNINFSVGSLGDGSNLSSGVYFYTLRAVPSSSSGQVFVQTRKMLLLK